MKCLFTLPVFFGLIFCTAFAVAENYSIENKFLVVTFDNQTSTFSVKNKADGRVFLKDGRIDAAKDVAAIVNQSEDEQSLLIPCRDGLTSLRLEKSNPFLFVERLLFHADKPTEIKNLRVAEFTLDLGKPADELRTLGTAGLTAPDKNPGSYLFLTLADPATRRGVVAGWLTHDRGDGVVFSRVKDNRVEFDTRIDYGRLILPEKELIELQLLPTETLVIGYFDDARLGLERFADAMAKLYKIKLPPQQSGYCTWYSDKHNGAGDEESIVSLAEFVAEKLKPYGFSFVQIDDEWQSGEKYNGPRRGFERVAPNGPYPHGMKPVAEQFKELGLNAGIWFMPFARNHQASEYADRQDWFVKRLDGTPYETSWGGTSLDITHPEVKKYVAELAKTIRGWGYNYFKMDGLWTGTATNQVYVNDGYVDDKMGDNAPFHDPTKTNIEAYRDALRLVREAAGPDVFFSGCNVSQNMRTLGGSIGLVDSMRIGPDNGQKWNDYRKEIDKNGSGSLITGPIRGARVYFLHGRVWWNDPDPYYVRASIPLNHARLLASWVAVSGQISLNSDWIPDLSAERLDIIRRTMPPHGVTARPVDYFDTPMPSVWLVTDQRRPVRRDVLGLFNWENDAREIRYATAGMGLDPTKTYHAFDFWADKPLGAASGEKIAFDVPGQSCRVIALRAAESHPVLAGTSRHVTQGIVDVVDETWDAESKTLSGISDVVGGDAYELRIAGLNDGGRWTLADIDISPADREAGVTIKAKPTAENEAGWLRVVITSKESRAVHWRLEFSREK